MNRLVVHLIVVASLSLTFFGVQTNIQRSVVALDFFGIAFVIYAVIQLAMGRWKLDPISGGYLAFIATLTVAAFINNTVLRGEFLNVVRTHVLGVVYYLYARHSLGNERSHNQILVAIMICSAIYLPLSLQELARIWGEGFKHYETMFGPLMNLNGWGFTWLLVAAAAMLGWSTVQSRSVRIGCMLTVAVSIALVPLSFSRSAFIGLAAFAVIFVLISFPRYRATAFLLGGGSVILFNVAVSFLGRGFDDTVVDFWAAKQDAMWHEIVVVRLQELTIDPMIEAAQNGVGAILFGGGISTDHGIFSHTFVSAGLLGLVALAVYHFLIFGHATALYHRCLPANRLLARRAYGAAVAVTVVVLANDFAVNLRSYLPPVCLFFNLMLGIAMSRLAACATGVVAPPNNPRRIFPSAAHFSRRIPAR